MPRREKNEKQDHKIDLGFARTAAANSAANEKRARQEFEQRQVTRSYFYLNQTVWSDWPRVWENIELHRQGKLEGDYDAAALPRVLDAILEATNGLGRSNNLRLAATLYDPAYCNGTEQQEEAEAVKIVLEILATIANGANTVTVVSQLLTLDPLPRLRQASFANQLVRIANLWPNHCDDCGCIQKPASFDKSLCCDCQSKQNRRNIKTFEQQQVPESPPPTTNAIPPNKRTKAMSKVEAMKYIGWPKHIESERQAVDWLNA